MNHDEKAREIKTAIGPWLRTNAYLVNAAGGGSVEFEKVLAAKLEKLYGEVPESLEAAVAKGFITFKGQVPIDDGYDCGSLIAFIALTVAPLLADKDRILELQHTTISRLNERVKELQKQRASIRLGIHDMLRRLEQGRTTAGWSAERNNIRNCLVGMQRKAAKEPPDEA